MRPTRSLFIAAVIAFTAPLAACGGTPVTTAAPSASTAPSAGAPSAAAPSASAPDAAPATTTTESRKATTAPPAPAGGGGSTTKSAPKGKVTSDLSGISITGIRTGKSVVIDVADDDADRFMQVGDGGKVAFTGTARTDTTMMALYPAAVSEKNRVLIKPSFWYEEVGDGYCVTDTPDTGLMLQPCKAGNASQVWRVVLAGDSGLFELRSAYGAIGTADRSTLQVLPYVD